MRLGEEFCAVETRFAVNVGGVNGRSLEGFGASTVQGDVFVFANGCENRSCVFGGMSNGILLECWVTQDVRGWVAVDLL